MTSDPMGGKGIKFVVTCPPEWGAGISGGMETVTVSFSTGFKDGVPDEVVESLRDALKEIYDGPPVQTAEEYAEEMKKEDAYYKRLGHEL